MTEKSLVRLRNRNLLFIARGLYGLDHAANRLSRISTESEPNQISKARSILALQQLQCLLRRGFQTSACTYINKKAGVPKAAIRKETLNYEQGLPPYEIGVKKAWNSWNTTNLKDEGGASEILLDDMFIRKFIIGTWHNLVVSEITIKRRFNIINIGMLLNQRPAQTQIYFLLGYSEELLSVWFKCPVKLEISTVKNAQKDMFYRNC